MGAASAAASSQSVTGCAYTYLHERKREFSVKRVLALIDDLVEGLRKPRRNLQCVSMEIDAIFFFRNIDYETLALHADKRNYEPLSLGQAEA